MDTLLQYDLLSNRNKLNVVGISLTNETAEQWDLLKDLPNCPTRLMAWMPNDEWNPVLHHGNLFMGIIHHPKIKEVLFRYKGKEVVGQRYHGYWRPWGFPVPLDGLDEIMEVRVNGPTEFEIAWLIVSEPQDQKTLESLKNFVDHY